MEFKTFCDWEKYTGVSLREFWITSCNNTQHFTCGNLEDNDFKYCPYCGKLIIEVSG